MNSHGTSKLDKIFTAHMKILQHLNTSKVTVTYLPTHYNHDKQLAHLPIPHLVRLKIALLVQQAVPIQ